MLRSRHDDVVTQLFKYLQKVSCVQKLKFVLAFKHKIAAFFAIPANKVVYYDIIFKYNDVITKFLQVFKI